MIKINGQAKSTITGLILLGPELASCLLIKVANTKPTEKYIKIAIM